MDNGVHTYTHINLLLSHGKHGGREKERNAGGGGCARSESATGSGGEEGEEEGKMVGKGRSELIVRVIGLHLYSTPRIHSRHLTHYVVACLLDPEKKPGRLPRSISAPCLQYQPSHCARGQLSHGVT